MPKPDPVKPGVKTGPVGKPLETAAPDTSR
jgi:hypothetical protein